MMNYFAGFDLGGSHARILLTDAQGKPLHRRTGDGISMKMVTAEDACTRFQPLVTEATKAINASPADCLGCCVAASGVDTPELAEKTFSVFHQLGFPAKKLLIVNDCEVFLYRHNEPMIILTVGTGSIAFGRTPAHGVVRCGGWGRMLSDEGSGFDMGLRVLRLMGNHFDERTHCPALHRLFCSHSDLRRSADIDAFAIDNLLTKKAVAELAPLLLQAAQQGDTPAQAELSQCIDLQVKLVTDTVQKLSLQKDATVDILLWGGILTGATAITSRVTAGILAALPKANITQPDTDALGAAVHLARKRFLHS